MALRFNDVSHYQGDYHPHGPTIAKATEGTSFVDGRYATNRQRTLAGGWPFAGYHFLTTHNAAAQARHAYATMSRTPAMLDVESGTTGNPSLRLTLEFIDAYRHLGGVLHLVYIPKWYWSGMWHSPSLKPLIDRGMALISSQYTTYSDNGPGWSAYGGMKPSIWQYTSTPIDTNAFKGTQAELDDLFRYGPAAVPGTGDDMTPAEFAAILRDTQVAPLMRALPWQYDGRGFSVPGVSNPSTLAALNAAAHAAQGADIASLNAKIDALTAAVTAIAQGGTSIDTAAVLAAIQAAGDKESQQMAAAQAQIAALQAELDEVKALLESRTATPVPLQGSAPGASSTETAGS